MNYVAGVPRPNSVIAPIGADGKIKIFASEQTHVIVDVMGWLGNAGQSEYVEVPSTRLLDTRLPNDTGPKLAAGGTIHLQVVGAVVPPNARSVVLNVTATDPDEPGFLTVYPGGAPRPFTSNLNYLTGQTIPNAVIVGLGPTGTIDIFSQRRHTSSSTSSATSRRDNRSPQGEARRALADVARGVRCDGTFGPQPRAASSAERRSPCPPSSPTTTSRTQLIGSRHRSAPR